MDQTNRYRKPERREAYEYALRLASQMSDADLWQWATHLEIALMLENSIPREIRKQIAAKAIRVIRHRRE